MTSGDRYSLFIWFLPKKYVYSQKLKIHYLMSIESQNKAIVSLLDNVLGKHGRHEKYDGQITYCCPTCSYDIKGLDKPDGKYNLEVNYKLGVYKCWVCSETHDTHGTLYKLIKTYGSKKHLNLYLSIIPSEETEYKKTYEDVKLPAEYIKFTEATAGMRLLPQFRQGLNYIRSRNITDEMINRYNIGICLSGVYENRIIIPSYDKNHKINYFIGRSFLSKTKMKYLNPEAKKEIIVFNEFLINWNKDIYIVEGVFDSIFLPNSIPLLGKVMSDMLFNLIYNNAKKRIIIILDPDARKDNEMLYHKMNCGKLMGRVYAVLLEGNKDIAELNGDITGYKLRQLD